MDIKDVKVGDKLWAWDVSTYRVYAGCVFLTDPSSHRLSLVEPGRLPETVNVADVYRTRGEAEEAARRFAGYMRGHYQALADRAAAAQADTPVIVADPEAVDLGSSEPDTDEDSTDDIDTGNPVALEAPIPYRLPTAGEADCEFRPLPASALQAAPSGPAFHGDRGGA